MSKSQIERKRATVSVWIRRGFIVWATVSTTWLLNSYRTRGFDRTLLESDERVSLRRTSEFLSFIPTSKAASTGLVFIAGAGVAPEAYAPMLRPIATEGHRTYVVALPFRIAPMEQHRAAAVARALAIIDSDKAVESWVIAGHSLGGALTCRIAEDAPSKVKGFVLVGTSHPKRVDLSDVAIPITKVFGSNDGIATLKMIEANKHLLPISTRWVVVDGGNHSQFGHYGHQLLDGSPTISRQEQQAITRAALMDALTRVGQASAQSTYAAGNLRRGLFLPVL